MSNAPTAPENNPADSFTEEQRQYLAGFTVGSGLAASSSPAGLTVNGKETDPAPAPTDAEPQPIGPDAIHHRAQDRVTQADKKLCKEEKAKREKNALDMWDEMVKRADDRAFPKGTDVLLTKFHGMFYVAPAQDSYMCRLRLPGGVVSTAQFRGVARIADDYGGGYSHVTTRANLQIREIPAEHPIHVLTELMDLGIICRGSGADNIRNITGSPTAGFDSDELLDTRPLARRMHHHILHHRELYGLPRKFNIAFDGGGAISALADTNDVGFAAVRVPDDQATDAFPAGVYVRLQLGGITGHGDFARDTGIMVRPDQAVDLASAVVRVFIEHGDRTNRTKARLKYLLDDWGFDKFIDHVREQAPFDLVEFPLENCERRRAADERARVGVHPQAEDGMNYVGVILPAARIDTDQMRAVADIADRFGDGEIRLTVWQNLLIPHVADADVEAVTQALADAGLTHQAHSVRAGLVACTGNTGCKFAASNTKGHALQLADYVEPRVELDQPVNIHFTGCHNSCAQHYIGDIGLLGAKVDPSGGEDDDAEEVEGYHVYVGGGYGEDAAIGRELTTDVMADDVPELVERMLRGYLEHRESDDESFQAFAARHEIDQLRDRFAMEAEPAA